MEDNWFEGAPINHFRARVEIELAKRNLNVSEVARRINKTAQHVSQVLDRGDPKTSTLQEIADAIGVEPDVLLKKVTPEQYGEVMIPRKK